MGGVQPLRLAGRLMPISSTWPMTWVSMQPSGGGVVGVMFVMGAGLLAHD